MKKQHRKQQLDDVSIETEGEEQDVSEQLPPDAIAAVLSATDWTTETLVSQLVRGNIQLNPRFQRRDAWRPDRKSRFIESLIVGLPVPQIVLAESKTERGKFLVLDGKQRLLAILQFWGKGVGPNNAYALSGLSLRKDLKGKKFGDFEKESGLQNDYNALTNQSIRTAVIKNWRDSDFLHTVFLRLNTGSVTLSPQELRQALIPGQFTSWVDDTAAASSPLQNLLGLDGPDPRMRDVEILARYLSFRFFANSYPGRLKRFLDSSFETFNANSGAYRRQLIQAVEDFDAGIDSLISIFGDQVARKPGSRQFNRAIFDALIYFQSREQVRKASEGRRPQIREAYDSLFSDDSGFLLAVESDTAGAPNTSARLRLWARALSKVTGLELIAPVIPSAADKEVPTEPLVLSPKRASKK